MADKEFRKLVANTNMMDDSDDFAEYSRKREAFRKEHGRDPTWAEELELRGKRRKF